MHEIGNGDIAINAPEEIKKEPEHQSTSSPAALAAPKEKRTRKSAPKNPTEFWARDAEQQGIRKRPRTSSSSVDKSPTFGGGAPFQSLTMHDPISAYRAPSESIESPVVAANTVKGQDDAFKKVLAENPKLDTRKCVTDLNNLKKHRMSFGARRFSVLDGRYLLEGMNSCKSAPVWLQDFILMKSGIALRDHQLIGASWTIERECSEKGPLGGILADEMVRHDEINPLKMFNFTDKLGHGWKSSHQRERCQKDQDNISRSSKISGELCIVFVDCKS